MKRLALVCTTLACLASNVEMKANCPDSVWLYLYTTAANANHDGLHWAWSADGKTWQVPYPSQKLVSSDYGIWGAEKRMFSPYSLRDNNGVWHLLWGVSETDCTFAHCTSTDLINWKPQNYPFLTAGNNCLLPEATIDATTGEYLVTWQSVNHGDTVTIGAMSPDLMHYSSARQLPANTRVNKRVNIKSVADDATGVVSQISRNELQQLMNNAAAIEYNNALYSEKPADDATRFAALKPFNATLTATGEQRSISPLLMGIFFEDISRAADGGLYAELVQNRDFEYSEADRNWHDPKWNARRAWSVKGEGLSFVIDSVSPIHANNAHYAVVTSQGNGGALSNSGFSGIALKKGAKYDLSLYANRVAGKAGKFRVSLVDTTGVALCSTTLSAGAGKWSKLTATLTPSASAAKATLQIEPLQQGDIAFDMVSLFPRDTFKGRKNGLRRDLADTIAALKPRFVRFPGGCVSHGDGIGNIYRWKNTIGALEARVPQRNIWGYHQTAGLGYHEYFQFCEDLGAEPLPVVAAGVPCQNSSCGGAGQQGGIPMADMPQYVQDILDLVEYANGDAKTTKWGAERARNGHKAPFNLKYLGVGNEDLISDVFEERFEMIYKALKEKYPEITVIGTVGPFHSGSDYDEGWDFATRLNVPIVDEHYYESPSWFVYNQDFYDGYDRSKPHVYLGEYASQGNYVYNALAEAAYLCSVERNGDVVEMTSYAPLLAKEGQTNWNPDMIYFTNTEVKPTVNYRVQRLFGENSGVSVLPTRLQLEAAQSKAVTARIASSVVVADNGDLIVKLVNLLPVEVTVDLNTPEIMAGLNASQSGSVVKTVLTGEATSREASYTEEILISLPVAQTLQPYSFTVLRVRK
jgi:alpha-L-arabinofuranosidase